LWSLQYPCSRKIAAVTCTSGRAKQPRTSDVIITA
jgi:hypothetical protein